MNIKVKSGYMVEDEAIIGLICQSATKKYSHKIGMLNGDGILIEFIVDEESIHISNIPEEIQKLDVLFDFSEGGEKYDKRLIIMNHSLLEYARIMKAEYNQNDVVLIKNYIPSYKSEKTLFGPNDIKSFFGRGIQIFALELDVRIQNSVFLGVMESFSCNNDLLDSKVSLRRQLLVVYNELIKGFLVE